MRNALLASLSIGFVCLVCGCKPPVPESAPPVRKSEAAGPTASFVSQAQVRPESVIGLTAFDHDPLLILPPGPSGRYGSENTVSWGRFAESKLGPYLKSGDGGSRIAAALSVRNDLVVYAHADRDKDAELFVFRPRTNEIVPIASAVEMKSQLAAGAALDLAEPRLLQAGDTVWLVLRIADQLSLLRLDARLVAGGQPRLSRPFEQLTVADEPIRVKRDDLFFADTDNSLALFRPATGQSWRVAPGGRLIRQPDRPPRPTPTAPPLLLPTRPGEPPRVIEFIADVAVDADPLATPTGADRYPQLLIRSEKKQTVIDRDAMTLRLGFPIRALRLTAWCTDGRDIFAYDAMSGEVFKIELKDVDGG